MMTKKIVGMDKKYITLEGINKKISVTSKLEKMELRIGDSVEYMKNGDYFSIIKKVSESKEIISELPKDNYPYNFVSLGKIKNIVKKEINEIDRSLEKYSGKMKCILTNITPIFIGGRKEIKKIGEIEHTTEHFLKLKVNSKEKCVIPGSSLKGELRNIIDVLTTSCIRNVSDDKLEYREKSGKFGIIKEFPESSKDGFGIITEAIRIKVHRDALPFKYKKPGFYKIEVNNVVLEKFKLKAKNSNNKYKGVDPNSVKDKDDYNKLTTLDEDNTKNSIVLLWTSNELKDNKKYSKILVEEEGKDYKFTSEVYEEYKNFIKQRMEDEKDFYLGKEKLKKGDGVIFKKISSEDEIVRFSFAELPKFNYKSTPYDLIPEDFKTCKSKKLCPSCILFGTTGRNNKKEKEKNPTSRRGKIYISDAILEGDIKLETITLKPSGMPHPSLEEFYLKDGSYNNLGEIRGRKFYWHHTEKVNAKDENEYKKYMETLKDSNGKTKHNTTINFIRPKNKFHFEIVFKNLTKEELGVLIYALELETGLLHKIGRAKAFGFGSSKIEIESILLDNDEKYQSFIIEDKSNEINKDFYILEAKKEYKFDEKDEVKELKYILSANNILDFRKSPFPEDYRRKKSTNEKNSQEETTLNWFLNKKEKKELFLPTISDYIKEAEKRKGKK